MNLRMVSSKRNPQHAQFRTAYSEPSIVLIPGIGTISPKEWPFANEEWLATLPGSSAGTRIFAYEYASPFAGAKPSWESILMLGHDLLQHISNARSSLAPDMVRFIRPLRIIRKPADLLLDHQQANFDSLPQPRWYYSQTGIMYRRQAVYAV